MLGNFHAFCRLLIKKRVSKSSFSKIYFRNRFRDSNTLGPDQAQHFVRSHLGSNCLKRLSADDPSRQELRYMYCPASKE